MNFEEIDTERSTKKNDRFWLLWRIFKEHMKQNIIAAVLRKAHSHSHLQIDKKINNVKEDPRKKTDSNCDLPSAAWCLWGFNKKECYVVHIIELFLHQKELK